MMIMISKAAASMFRKTSTRVLLKYSTNAMRLPVRFPTRSFVNVKDLYLLNLLSIPVFRKHPTLLRHLQRTLEESKFDAVTLLQLYELGEKHKFGEKLVTGDEFPVEFEDRSQRIVDIAWNALADTIKMIALLHESNSESADNMPLNVVAAESLPETGTSSFSDSQIEALQNEIKWLNHKLSEKETQLSSDQKAKQDLRASYDQEERHSQETIRQCTAEIEGFKKELAQKEKKLLEKDRLIQSLQSDLLRLKATVNASSKDKKPNTTRADSKTKENESSSSTSRPTTSGKCNLPKSAETPNTSRNSNDGFLDEETIAFVKKWDPYWQFVSWFKSSSPTTAGSGETGKKLSPSLSSSSSSSSCSGGSRNLRCSRGARRN